MNLEGLVIKRNPNHMITSSQSLKDHKQTFEPCHWKRTLIAYANSKGSGEPAHKRSLARTYAVR